MAAELWRKDGPGLFGRLRSKLRPPPNDRPPAGARPVDSPEPSRGEDGCEGCEPSSLSEPSSSPPRPEPKPPMTSGMRSLGEYACHERVLALARRVQSEAGAGSSAAAREPNDGCVPRSRVVEWRAMRAGAGVCRMRPPPSPQAAPIAASALCPYRCPWTIAIQADPTPVCPTWTSAIATYGHWWRAHLRCVRVQLVQRVACLYQSCLPVPSQSPVGHGERDSLTAAGRRPQARRPRRLRRLRPCSTSFDE